MLHKNLSLPELLAPAGTPSCALAAFDAGADAIYAGLKKFNARERGENFTSQRMGQIIDYAHRNGRKVYITLNTLIRETELSEVVETLSELESLAPDALLVQDLGVIRIAREYFPKLVLHGSTQMGFHNSPGILFAQRLGLSRVVLERQITMEELAQICKNSPLELEVFIHGALCCSLSGACLFSSWLGGHSGNRGKCKQPCRRRYFSKSGNGFFFSPQDLCAIELLPQLCKLGVSSLKIEGRLRQPDYVLNTVQAYRMLLDAPENEFDKLLPEARNLLSKGCGRRWSRGFYFADSTRDLIKSDSIGASGLLCGAVEAVRDNGFGFTTKRRLFLGDRLRVQPLSGDDGAAVTLTKIFVENAPAKRALPGERIFVCCDRPMPEKGLIFKIGESFPDYTKRLESLPARRTKLNLDLSLTAEKLSVRVTNAPLPVWEKNVNLSPAQNRPVSLEQLQELFSASDSSDFALGDFKGKTDPLFFPAAIGKSLRREFWEFGANNLTKEMVFLDSGNALDKFLQDYRELSPRYTLLEYLTETIALKIDGAEPANRKALRANDIWHINRLSNEAILPEFCPEPLLEKLKRSIRNAYEQNIRRFRVTSLYGLELLKNYKDIKIIASTPLPVANSMAANELSNFNVSRVTAHIEMNKSDVINLRDHCPIEVECYRLGRPCLLITRAEIPVNGPFKDARGNEFEFRVERDHLGKIYPKAVFSIPHVENVYDFYDLRNANWKNSVEATFNFEAQWL